MAPPPPLDRLGRSLGVLRLSLTARCNLACPYCLPDGQEPAGLLTQEQRLAVIRAAVALGVRSLRLTGGEPLLHPGLEALIAEAAALRGQEAAADAEPSDTPKTVATPHSQKPALAEIALTSNGTLLTAARARALRHAGLDRITLSLDGADAASVARMAGLAEAAAGERALAAVLAALQHARSAGFDPAAGQLKLNAVIQRGSNDEQLLPLAQLARERGVELRLIEFMDVGTRNGWHGGAVVPAAELLQRIGQRWPLEPLGRSAGGTASRWRYRDGGGVLAVVASVSEPFCGDCNRLRVTADGIAYTCLFAHPGSGVDLRPWLAADDSPTRLIQGLTALWQRRDDRYSEDRSQAQPHRPRHAEMAYLGG